MTLPTETFYCTANRDTLKDHLSCMPTSLLSLSARPKDLCSRENKAKECIQDSKLQQILQETSSVVAMAQTVNNHKFSGNHAVVCNLSPYIFLFTLSYLYEIYGIIYIDFYE